MKMDGTENRTDGSETKSDPRPVFNTDLSAVYSGPSRRLQRLSRMPEIKEMSRRVMSSDPVAGIDVGKRKSTFVVLEPVDSYDGIQTSSYKRDFAMTEKGMEDAMSYLRSKLVKRIILESTSVYHQRLCEVLTEAGFEVNLVNPSIVNPKTQIKTDPRDAESLAEKLLFGTVGQKGRYRPSYQPTPYEQQIRQASRLMNQLTNERTRCKNRIHKLVDAHSIPLKKYIGNSTNNPWLYCLRAVAHMKPIAEFTEQLKTEQTLPVRTRKLMLKRIDRYSEFFERCYERFTSVDYIMLQTLTSEILSINNGIEGLKENIKETIETAPKEFQHRVQLALSISGIGKDLAAKLVAEFGNPHRFSNRREVSRYTGLNPTVRSSGGKTYIGGVTKQGNKHIRRMLFIAAEAASRYDSKFAIFNKRLKKKGKTHKERMCAIGRKIGVMYIHLAKKNECYDEDKNGMKYLHDSDARNEN